MHHGGGRACNTTSACYHLGLAVRFVLASLKPATSRAGQREPRVHPATPNATTNAIHDLVHLHC